ncbi:pentatricopeptide repeat-containing protein At2g17210 [Beta vulgaris subsp. vulgaris]|uniref:pentatricopeptide repeat-containing protein At2g17210 n=1 Tax=Beta vulgaris subsp. vulgaris TaxID=3555 RepID=UPI00053FA575|nr:pentatricopeptide repeat-containing protein At2g17210 [Beta vulgaris subsp. vulgaris]
MRPRFSPLNLRLPEWNLRIKECLSNGHWQEAISCYVGLRRSGEDLTDISVFPSIMKASSKISFKHGESMHACSVKQGYDFFSTSVMNSTLDFYMKWGAPISALSVFRGMRNRDSISWNIVIHGYLDHGLLEDGLWFFLQGRVSGFEPNVSTLVLVAQAYRVLVEFAGGRKFHGYVLKSGFLGVLSVQNSLLGMYADAGIDYAHQMFDEMCERDVISWSMMIGACVQYEEPLLALQIFKDMEVEPDGLTMVSILKAGSNLEDDSTGRCLHGSAISRGHDTDVFVSNSLIDMYSKCSDPISALRVFDEMTLKNVVSWNSILSGLIYNRMHDEAFVLANSLVQAKTETDEVTLVNLLQLYKYISEPFQCKLIHSRVMRHGYELNTMVLNSLIDAYAKCNLIELSWRLFIRTNNRDTVLWATMIGSFAYCGMPDEAVTVFHKMSEVGERKNLVVVLNLLEACTVTAELKCSKWAHGIAIRSSLAAYVSIGTAITDMYSKCGAVEEARKAFDQITQKNIMSWSTMVSAYGMNGQAQDALNLVTAMKQHGFQPNAVIALSVLAACSHGGLIQSGLSFFKEMVEDFWIEPNLEHYACIIDMLSRSGKLEFAMELIKIMPEHIKGQASIWGAVLSACTRYKNVEIGEGAVSQVLELEPYGSSGYLLASSLHASTGSWNDAAKMRRLVKKRGVRIVGGYSLVRVGDRALRFVAGEKSTTQGQGIENCCIVEHLHRCMHIDEAYDGIIE